MDHFRSRARRSAQKKWVAATGSAVFVAATCNAKLAPIERVPTATRPRPTARPPFVSTTSASIQATCPKTCPFIGRGCYAEVGFTRFIGARLDEAARGAAPEEVIAEEVRLMDGAFGGGRIPDDGTGSPRALRLHVGGDVGSEEGARMLAAAAFRWQRRGGGPVWTYSHWWRLVPRSAWGVVSVLASVETATDIEQARAAGYVSAITVDAFPSERAFRLRGSTARIIPCPAETRQRTCAECRLCLDGAGLFRRNQAIAFAPHGSEARRVRETLIQLRRRRDDNGSDARRGKGRP